MKRAHQPDLTREPDRDNGSRTEDLEAFDLSYERLFERLPVSVMRATAEGRIIDANPAAIRTFGFTDLASMRGRLAGSLYVDEGERADLVARVEAGMPPSELECEMLRADGSHFWFSSVVSAVWNRDGRAIAWEVVGRDISAQKAREIELARTQEHARSVLGSAAVAIATLDSEGRFSFAGGRVLGLLGVEAASLLGLTVAQAFPGRDDLAVLIARGVAADVQEDLQFGGRTLRFRCTPFRPTEHGEVAGVRVVVSDITEEVAAEEAARAARAEDHQRQSARADQQALLLEISRAGLEAREVEDFLATSIEFVARGTAAPFGTILEMQGTDSVATRVATFGLAEPVPPDPKPLDASAVGLEALKAELRSPRRYNYSTDAPALPRSAWMIEYGVTASVVVGIYGSSSPFGILSVHTDRPIEFTEHDLQFVQQAATIISVAVERQFAEKQRRLLLSRLVTSQEAERRSIATRIHDDAVQVLTAANMRLALFSASLYDRMQVEAAEKLQRTVSLATGRLRTLLFELSPPDLERHGLTAAVRGHLERFEADTGVRSGFRSNLGSEPPLQARILLFRILQEALSNVHAHAAARNVSVSLTSVDRGVLMRVTDDGGGVSELAAEPRLQHLGLASMRERAEIGGGWWRLTSAPGRGTEITTWVPSPPDDDPASSQAAGLLALT